MKEFSERKKMVKQTMEEQFNASNPEYMASYKLSVLKYPGDALLDESDYKKVHQKSYKFFDTRLIDRINQQLLAFVGENKRLQGSIRYTNGTKNLTREGK